MFSKSGTVIPAATLKFDDNQWTAVDLPHDWAVELPFVWDSRLNSHGYKPVGRWYPETSVGWYRRVFDIPAADDGRRISLEFDGMYRAATVMLNGHYLGENFSGYAPCRFDVTDFISYGAKNVLLVRVDASMNEGWFYEGAGIYRHAWLVKTHPLHVTQGGLFAHSEGPSGVIVRAEFVNQSDRERESLTVLRILDPQGRVVQTSESGTRLKLPAWGAGETTIRTGIASPALWSIETPNLYRAEVTLMSDGAALDRVETTFGFRTVEFYKRGFFLNGQRIEIKGTCNHQDHAGVGAAVPDGVFEYRVQRLKEMGCNAWRTAHNPPAPELLDACDRLGMLVMDETRMLSSSAEGLSQLERMIRRDRNHPSIVLWSIGNEEPEQGTPRGAREAVTMKRLVQKLDPTRLITEAMNYGWGGKGMSNVVDVQGFNYNQRVIDGFRKDHPDMPLIGSENSSALSTRGVYANDKERGYVSAYDTNKPDWGEHADEWWKFYDARPYLAGGFVWTGFDYRGEPTPYAWPCINSHFGIMDTCGFAKDNFYYYQAWWSGRRVLHLFPHWNWAGREGQEIEVWCHTNQERVELFLNGRSLGARDVAKNDHAMWKVAYAPGVLEARAGSLVSRRETTGAPAKIALHPHRTQLSANGQDVAVIRVEVQDAQGRVVPTAGNMVRFNVAGGKLIGVGNGDASCHEPDKASQRSAFNGLCQAIVQASRTAGEIKVEASADGLTGAALKFVTSPS